MIRLGGAVGSALVHRTGDLDLNPGPGDNFSFKIMNVLMVIYLP